MFKFVSIIFQTTYRMKKINFFKVVLLALLTFQFIACEDEPLTGDFPQDDDTNAEIGQFKALVDGNQFIAATTDASLSSENELVITGTKVTGEKIKLTVFNAAVGVFDLSANQNLGSYYDTSINERPFNSSLANGGSGEIEITEINTQELTISGTFKFVGFRVKVDSNGETVLDGNGDPVLESIDITKGTFNAIPYVDGGSGNGGNGGNPLDEFFAKVDEVGFIADSISVTEPIVANTRMLKVEAFNDEGASIRIDIPKSLGIGTHNMVNISNGTDLIGLYNAGGGSEFLTSNPGTLTITEFDLELGILKANFSFRANDPLGQVGDEVLVTEGRLTAHFEGVPGGNNLFKAKIGDASYNPLDIEVTTDVVNQYPTITITTNIESQRMVLTFPATISEGTYAMGTEVIEGNEIVGTYTPEVGTSIDFISNPGTLTITNYNYQENTIQGIFTFKAKDLNEVDPTIYNITEGSFYLELE